MSAGSKSTGNINYQEKSTSGEQNGYFSTIEVYSTAKFLSGIELTPPLTISSGGTGLSTTGTTGQLLITVAPGQLGWVSPGSSGIGTVTSVGISAPPWMTVTNSPITTSGTIHLLANSTGSGIVVLANSPTIDAPIFTTYITAPGGLSGSLQVEAALEVNSSEQADLDEFLDPPAAISTPGGLVTDKNILIRGNYNEPTQSGNQVLIKSLNVFKAPTLSATHPVVYPGAATVKIEGSPIAGDNVTIVPTLGLDSFGLWVEGGIYADKYISIGDVTIGGSLEVIGDLAVIGNFSIGDKFGITPASRVEFYNTRTLSDKRAQWRFYGTSALQPLYIGPDPVNTSSFQPTISFTGSTTAEPLLSLVVLSTDQIPRIIFGNYITPAMETMWTDTFYGTKYYDRTVENYNNLTIGVTHSPTTSPFIRFGPVTSELPANNLYITQDSSIQHLYFNDSEDLNLLELGVKFSDQIPFIKFGRDTENTMKLQWTEEEQEIQFSDNTTAQLLVIGVTLATDVPYIAFGRTGENTMMMEWTETDQHLQFHDATGDELLSIGVNVTTDTPLIRFGWETGSNVTKLQWTEDGQQLLFTNEVGVPIINVNASTSGTGTITIRSDPNSSVQTASDIRFNNSVTNRSALGQQSLILNDTEGLQLIAVKVDNSDIPSILLGGGTNPTAMKSSWPTENSVYTEYYDTTTNKAIVTIGNDLGAVLNFNDATTGILRMQAINTTSGPSLFFNDTEGSNLMGFTNAEDVPVFRFGPSSDPVMVSTWPSVSTMTTKYRNDEIASDVLEIGCKSGLGILNFFNQETNSLKTLSIVSDPVNGPSLTINDFEGAQEIYIGIASLTPQIIIGPLFEGSPLGIKLDYTVFSGVGKGQIIFPRPLTHQSEIIFGGTSTNVSMLTMFSTSTAYGFTMRDVELNQLYSISVDATTFTPTQTFGSATFPAIVTSYGEASWGTTIYNSEGATPANQLYSISASEGTHVLTETYGISLSPNIITTYDATHWGTHYYNGLPAAPGPPPSTLLNQVMSITVNKLTMVPQILFGIEATPVMTQTWTDTDWGQTYLDGESNHLIKMSVDQSTLIPSLRFGWATGSPFMMMDWTDNAQRLRFSDNLGVTTILNIGTTIAGEVATPNIRMSGGTITQYDAAGTINTLSLSPTAMSLTPAGPNTNITLRTAGAAGNIAVSTAGAEGGIVISTAGGASNIELSTEGAESNINLNVSSGAGNIELTAEGGESGVLLEIAGGAGNIALTTQGAATGNILLSTLGTTSNIVLSSAGGEGAVAITSTAAAGNIVMTAAGAEGGILINSTGAAGNIAITSEGAEGGILINTTAGAGNIAITAEGAEGAILINTTAAAGNIAMTAEGAEGAILINATGAAGNIAITSEGGEGAIAINTTAAAGNITITAEGAEGGIVINAAGAAANVAISAEGGEGNILLNVSAGTGNIEITAEGGEAGIVMNVAGGTGNIAISNESTAGIVSVSSLGGATGISLLAAGALTGIFINSIGAAAVTEISANGVSGSILLQTLGASGEIDIYATGASGVIKIIATGFGGQLLMGVNTGGGAARLYTSTGNTQLVSNSGAVQVSAPQGGFQVGRYGTYGGDDQVGHVGLHAHNNTSGFATGNIEIATHTQAIFTGPGNLDIRTTDAYTGDITIDAKGEFNLRNRGTQVLNINGSGAVIRSISLLASVITFNISTPVTLTSSTLTGYMTFSATGSTVNSVILPDATIFYKSLQVTFNNTTAYTVSIYLHDGTTLLATLPTNTMRTYTLTDTSTTNGTWTVQPYGFGTVTSVGLAVPAWLGISGTNPITSSGTITITGTSTGTGTTTVLSGNPTLTSVTITDTKSSFTDAPLVVSNTNVHPSTIALLTAPNITVGDSTTITFGKGASLGNALSLGYVYQGNNNVSNSASIGFYGSSNTNVTLYNNGLNSLSRTTVSDTVSTSADAVFYVFNEATVSSNTAMFLQDQLATSNTTSLIAGRSQGTGNAMQHTFSYAGSNNTANSYAFSFYGKSANITVKNDGTITLANPTNVPSIVLKSTHNITLDASAATADYTWTYPTTVGTTDYVLYYTGSGTGWKQNSGTGNNVLQTSPTLTTPTINSPNITTPSMSTTTITDTVSSFTNAPLKVINTNTSPAAVELLTGPNMATNQTIYSVMGQSGTAGNAVASGFKYVSSNSSSNTFTFGFLGGSDDFTVKNDGTMYLSNAYGTSFNSSTFKIISTHNVTLDGSLAAADYTFKFPSSAGTSGQYLQSTGTGTQWATVSGTGTVTSVGLAVPAWLGISGTNPITSSGTITITGTSTGTGTTTVLSGNPTLTSATITDTKSSFTDAPLKVINTNTSPAAVELLTGPNMATNQTIYSVMGQSGTAGNAVAMGFKYVSSNSANNTFTFGFLGGSDDITVKHDGTMYLSNVYGTSFTGALAGAATLSATTVTASKSSFTDAPLVVSNTNVHPQSLAILTASSMTVNDIVVSTTGQSTSVGNSVSQYFKYVGNNSSTNEYGFGFFGGNNDISITNNGIIRLNGTVNTQVINITNPFTVTLSAALLTADYTFKFPNGAGTANYILQSTGTGTQWKSVTGTGSVVLANTPTLTSAIVSDTKSTYTDAPLVVNNTNTNPLSGLLTLAPNMASGNFLLNTTGQSVTVGNAAVLYYKHIGNNSSTNEYGFGFFGSGNDIAVKNNKAVTIGQDSSSPVTMPGILTAGNYFSGTVTVTLYGWTGSVSNPTGGPWTATAFYQRAGSAITAFFSCGGNYSSAAVGSHPYLSGLPTFGGTIQDYSFSASPVTSSFTGAGLPYNGVLGFSGGSSGHDMTFYSGSTQHTFQVAGGTASYGGVVTYFIT